MTHLVRHATRPRITASRAGADAGPLSKGDASMQTPHVRETAWNGNNRTFAWECVTTIEGSDMIQVPGARSRHRKGGAEQVHFIDPPKSMRAVRRNLRINLPAFLEEEPLSRLPERR